MMGERAPPSKRSNMPHANFDGHSRSPGAVLQRENRRERRERLVAPSLSPNAKRSANSAISSLLWRSATTLSVSCTASAEKSGAAASELVVATVSAAGATEAVREGSCELARPRIRVKTSVASMLSGGLLGAVAMNGPARSHIAACG